jgi:hypothetical protein
MAWRMPWPIMLTPPCTPSPPRRCFRQRRLCPEGVQGRLAVDPPVRVTMAPDSTRERIPSLPSARISTS